MLDGEPIEGVSVFCALDGVLAAMRSYRVVYLAPSWSCERRASICWQPRPGRTSPWRTATPLAGTVVRFRLLPGTIDEYEALVDRRRLSS